MCAMTDFGIRWKRSIEVPSHHLAVAEYAVSRRNGEDRYALVVNSEMPTPIAWLEPVYLIRIRRKPK